MEDQEQLLKQLEADVLSCEAEAAVKTAQAIVDAGVDLTRAIDVATAAINQIGDRFQNGEVYLPELMLAGETMKACMGVFAANMAVGSSARRRGKVVIGAVAGDIHDIGKNLVATQLSLKGFDVVDLGVNAAPMEIVDRAEHEKAQIIALSALMTTSMPYQGDVIKVLNEMGLRQKYFVVIGGGPVTPEYAAAAGADGWAANAVLAARLCESLAEGSQRPPLATPLTLG
jgi:methylmalonyl-CoA mutase cobalamin-binding domain/chain